MMELVTVFDGILLKNVPKLDGKVFLRNVVGWDEIDLTLGGRRV